jgi:hypothetical protein
MTSTHVTDMRDGYADAPGRQDQSVPSSRDRRAPHLTYRWQKASDGALVMVWSLDEAKVHASSSLTGAPASQPPELVPNEGIACPRQAKRRSQIVVEWIAVAVILSATGFATVMSFLVEHNNLL